MGIIDAAKTAVAGEAYTGSDSHHHSTDAHHQQQQQGHTQQAGGPYTGAQVQPVGMQASTPGVNPGGINTPGMSGMQPTGQQMNTHGMNAGMPGMQPTGQLHGQGVGQGVDIGVPVSEYTTGAHTHTNPGGIGHVHGSTPGGVGTGTGTGFQHHDSSYPTGYVDVDGSNKNTKKDQAAAKMVQAGVKLEQKKGAMGGKMDGVIDKAEHALAKAHDKVLSSKK